MLACSPSFTNAIRAWMGVKWGLSDLVIAERVKRMLFRAVQHQCLPPAYLFVGPAGVGKRTTAIALAKALNCPVPNTDACEQCAVCQTHRPPSAP